MKTFAATGAMMMASVQTAAAHSTLSPHMHVVDGGAYISWIEIAAGLTAAVLAVTYYRYRQAQLKDQLKKEKARRK